MGKLQNRINQITSMLGLLASILAVSSLTYDAFQQPLIPLMQGVMGGILDAYRSLRDLLFNGVGFIVTQLINLISEWLTWLPIAPWFDVPGYAKDIMTIYFMIGSSWARTVITAWEIENNMGIGGKPRLALAISLLRIAFWPIEYVIHLSRKVAVFTRQNQKYALTTTQKLLSISRFLTLEFLVYLAGVLVFFLLAYAENRVGL